MFVGRNIRVWAYPYPAPCDLRKGFSGLVGLVERVLCRPALVGATRGAASSEEE